MKRREWECWAVCEACRDTFSVLLFLRRNEEVFDARVERSQSFRPENGELIHRCGGKVKLFDLPGPTVLSEIGRLPAPGRGSEHV